MNGELNEPATMYVCSWDVALRLRSDVASRIR